MTRHLHVSTAPLAAIGYENGSLMADEFEKRSGDSRYMFDFIEKVEAVLDDIEGMKRHIETFMPKFSEETVEDYKFRKQCVMMTNVYSDIAGTLSSKPFEEPVKIIGDETDATDDTDDDGIPQEIKDFQWDVDGSGNNLTVFAADTFFNGMNNAIDWIMVDHEKMDETVVTVADAKSRGLRPYWSHVLHRNILDVQSTIIGGEEVLTYVKIFEPGDKDHIREFIRMTSVEGEVSVEWRLWRKGDDQKYTLLESGPITINVIPMVPFVTGRREGRRWRFNPPMRAAVELQIELFRKESRLNYIEILTGYPMLAANGIKPPVGVDGKSDTNIKTGPSKVLWSPPRDDGGPAGRWEYVEPSSESAKFLETRIEYTIQQLRELGRQPLTASSSNITVITAAVAAGKAKSAVKAWGYTLKDALENALRLTAMFMGLDYDPTVHVFVEFDDWMEGEDLDTLLTMHERGVISNETLYEEMKRRSVLSSNFTSARERVRILNQMPGDGEDMVDEDVSMR